MALRTVPQLPLERFAHQLAPMSGTEAMTRMTTGRESDTSSSSTLRAAAREPWSKPGFRIVAVADAEFGAASNPDGNNDAS